MVTKTRVHNDIPWTKIHKMWDAGKSYEFMARAVNRFNPKSDDPTKPLRAICSRALTIGYKNKEGKLVKFQPREGMRLIGVGKKAPKVKATAKAVAKTAAKGKPGRKPVFGKTILIGLDGTGKFFRIEVEKPKNLIPTGKALPSIINALEKLGMQVSSKPVAETAPAAVETVVAPEVSEPQAEVALPQVTSVTEAAPTQTEAA